MKASRPTLSPSLSPADFRRSYWLKQELVAFCRTNGLPTSGGKQEISARIEQFLADGVVIAPTSKQTTKAAMPATLHLDTVITPGFRCSQALRAFFLAQIGPHFHFDHTMRQFIKHGSGHTLAEAISIWQAAQANTSPRAIEPQFEYNRHMREFFQTHPGATRAQAIAAWWQKRGRPEE